jgi:hypothetical protein
VTLATMLQRWHNYAYDDYKESNIELPIRYWMAWFIDWTISCS